MTSPRILLVQVLSLWILGQGKLWICWGGGGRAPGWQEGFGMLWVDTGGIYLLCPRAGLDLGSEQDLGLLGCQGQQGWDVTPGGAAFPVSAGDSQLFQDGSVPAAAPGCPAKELGITQLAELCLQDGCFGGALSSSHALLGPARARAPFRS